MLFDPIASREAKNGAMARVEENADEEFRRRALEAVQVMARTRSEFTTDDAVEYLAKVYPEVSTHEPRAWGPIMRAAAREGWIVNTLQVRQSNMVSNHRRPKAIWRSELR